MQLHNRVKKLQAYSTNLKSVPRTHQPVERYRAIMALMFYVFWVRGQLNIKIKMLLVKVYIVLSLV